MEFIQGKDCFNEMATGILVKLFADYPAYSSFEFSDFGWKPRGDRTQIDLLCNTLQALSDMGYIEIISSTDMDSAAKLTPRGLNLLQQQWICPYISRHLLSLNPLLARCRRYSRGER